MKYKYIMYGRLTRNGKNIGRIHRQGVITANSRKEALKKQEMDNARWNRFAAKNTADGKWKTHTVKVKVEKNPSRKSPTPRRTRRASPFGFGFRF